MQIGKAIIIFLTLWCTANAFKNCSPQSDFQLVPGQSVPINNPNHPNSFPDGNCQLTITTAIYNQILLACLLYVGVGDQYGACDPGDSFYVQTDGTKNIVTGTRYCGSAQTIELVSRYNSLTIGYTATQYSGIWRCNATAKPEGRCDCGQRPTARIVGGYESAMGQFPYMAAVVKTGQKPTLKGGASILSSTVLLCAAHVFWENNAVMPLSNLSILLGRIDLRKAEADDTPYAATYKPYRIVIHPNYNHQTGNNDIAVILVDHFILFNKLTQPICLPSRYEEENKYYGTKIRAVGYGAVDFASDFSYKLKYVDLTVISNDECSRKYGDELSVTPQDLCHVSSSDADTCQGDSGGPCFTTTFRDFLVCSVKSGGACGTGDPGECQKVSPYIPWIEQVSPGYNFYCYYYQ